MAEHFLYFPGGSKHGSSVNKKQNVRLEPERIDCILDISEILCQSCLILVWILDNVWWFLYAINALNKSLTGSRFFFFNLANMDFSSGVLNQVFSYVVSAPCNGKCEEWGVVGCWWLGGNGSVNPCAWCRGSGQQPIVVVVPLLLLLTQEYLDNSKNVENQQKHVQIFCIKET